MHYIYLNFLLQLDPSTVKTRHGLALDGNKGLSSPSITPPPTGVGRTMERKRQKTCGSG